MKKYVIITISIIQKCPSRLKKILKYINGEKSLKNPFVIYLDFLSEKSYTQKKTIDEPSGQAMFSSCSFDEKENKLD